MNTLQQHSTNFSPTSTMILQEKNQENNISTIAELLMKAINKKQQLQKESA